MDFIELSVGVKTLTIRRVKRKDLQKFLQLNRKVLEHFIYYNGAVGNVISDDKAWADIEELCKYLPVDGEKEIGLDMSLFEEDWDSIIELFFSTSWNRPKGEYENIQNGFKSSLLARLNRIDYDGDWVKSMHKVKEMKEKEEKTTTKR